MPCVGQAWVDARAFGVKDHRHFMTVCFCCDCCGRCLDVCIFSQLKLAGGRAVMGDDCKACA